MFSLSSPPIYIPQFSIKHIFDLRLFGWQVLYCFKLCEGDLCKGISGKFFFSVCLNMLSRRYPPSPFVFLVHLFRLFPFMGLAFMWFPQPRLLFEAKSMERPTPGSSTRSSGRYMQGGCRPQRLFILLDSCFHAVSRLGDVYFFSQLIHWSMYFYCLSSIFMCSPQGGTLWTLSSTMPPERET